MSAGTIKIHKHTIRINRHNNEDYISYNIKKEYNHKYIDKKEPKEYITSNFILSVCLLIMF